MPPESSLTIVSARGDRLAISSARSTAAARSSAGTRYSRANAVRICRHVSSTSRLSSWGTTIAMRACLDVRESPALDIIHLLGKRGASVTYSDPFVPNLHADGVVPEMSAIDAEKGAAEADCVVIVTDHKRFRLCAHC